MAAAAVPFSILIIGSTGAFGQRIAELLARDGNFDLTLAGRTRASLEAQAKALATKLSRPVGIVVLDARSVEASTLRLLGAHLVINASGPFQDGTYELGCAAIGAGCHYVDLADARRFVTGFAKLNDMARAAGVLAVSGASSVPGLSSAVVAHHRNAFERLEAIDIAISPGNAFDPGVATVASVLGGVGQPIRMLLDGDWRTVHGWQGLRRQSFGEIGPRWLGYVDVPDLDLFPAHDTNLKNVRFQAGLEVPAFHLGLWMASWLVRSGLVGSLAPLAPAMLSFKRTLSGFGSDRGGMIVEMRGIGKDGKPKALSWQLSALSGHGPYVPTLACVALARRLASGAETRRGAMACHGVVDLTHILDVAEGLDIRCATKEEVLPP